MRQRIQKLSNKDRHYISKWNMPKCIWKIVHSSGVIKIFYQSARGKNSQVTIKYFQLITCSKKVELHETLLAIHPLRCTERIQFSKIGL